MAHRGKVGIIVAVLAASLLSGGASAELDLTPVPVVPVDRAPPVSLDSPTDSADEAAADTDEASDAADDGGDGAKGSKPRRRRPRRVPFHRALIV